MDAAKLQARGCIASRLRLCICVQPSSTIGIRAHPARTRHGSPPSKLVSALPFHASSSPLTLAHLHWRCAVIAAVRLGRTAGSKGYSGNARLVGVAFVDIAARAIGTSEFEDDENLCTLESLLCQQESANPSRTKISLPRPSSVAT
eukprot:scaffold330238_cov59-Tisochrysis_lutea.AAC.2